MGYRKFNFTILYDSAMQTLSITTMITFVTVGAMMFSGVFMALNGAVYIGDLVTALPLGKWGILFVMMFVVFVLGAFIDWIAILFIAIPIFTPIALHVGFDPLWFAMLVCVNLQMSFLTPPFAYTMFYLKGIAPPEVTMAHIYWGVVPFIGLQIIGLALCIVFPEIITWLPNVAMK